MPALLMHRDPPPGSTADLPRDPMQLPGGQPAGWLDALSRWSACPLPAGQCWDAVRITGTAAPLVYGLMHQQTLGNTGPVVIDALADAHYWLIRPDYQASWDFPGVRLCSTGTWVVLPPKTGLAPRVHWLARPRPDGALVHAPLLHSTIASVTAP